MRFLRQKELWLRETNAVTIDPFGSLYSLLNEKNNR